MKSIFDNTLRKEVITRINSLTKNSTALWGEMTVEQMVKHCILCEKYYHGQFKVKRSPIGQKIGAETINEILKDEDTKIGLNAKTSHEFIVLEKDLDLIEEKKNWIELLNLYEFYNLTRITHWFFGDMTKEQLGQFIYKHCDHHLRQFGA
ncbi:MAG TPA: DUF1569 domain-containing protein [Flavobacteriaceae bacterium]